MRALGIGLVMVGLLAIGWGESSAQAAFPSSLAGWVVSGGVGHPPGPGRYWHPRPAPPPPCVVLPPPPPPPPPPRRIYYVYPPAVYYPYPSYYYEYPSSHGTFYYSTPRAGIAITW